MLSIRQIFGNDLDLCNVELGKDMARLGGLAIATVLVFANSLALALTGPQANAVRSAEQYLGFAAFSRLGLIAQLSSEYGDAYEVADATVAVDSLTVDWNAQAVRSAKEYLQMSGFSCKGLIDQLSSEYGSQFTISEATFGAEQAGAC